MHIKWFRQHHNAGINHPLVTWDSCCARPKWCLDDSASIESCNLASEPAAKLLIDCCVDITILIALTSNYSHHVHVASNYLLWCPVSIKMLCEEIVTWYFLYPVCHIRVSKQLEHSVIAVLILWWMENAIDYTLLEEQLCIVHRKLRNICTLVGRASEAYCRCLSVCLPCQATFLDASSN